MPTNFPTSLDSYTNKVDGVDTVQAAHVNNLQDAVVAIETKLGNNSQQVNAPAGVAVPRTAGNSTVALNCAATGSAITIAAGGSGSPVTGGGTASVFGGFAIGGLVIITEIAIDGGIAVFAVSGGGGLQKIADPGGIYATTYNNGNTINVYFNGSDLTIQNNRGSSRTFNVMVLRTR